MGAAGWFEDYECGCTSKVVRYKKNLTGYCGVHGENRRHIWTATWPIKKARARQRRGG